MGKNDLTAPRLDKDGRPKGEVPSLVPTEEQPNPQVVYVSKPITPDAKETDRQVESQEARRQDMRQEAQRRHEASKRKYPDLNLREGEYVVSVIDCVPIGLLRLWAGVALLSLALLILVPAFLFIIPSLVSPWLFVGLLVVVIVALAALAVVGTIFYGRNQLYLTSEHVMIIVQNNIFKTQGKTVPLMNIENVIYAQEGPLQSMLDIGSLEFSTEGRSEAEFRFFYVRHPQRWVQKISNVIDDYRERNNVTGD